MLKLTAPDGKHGPQREAAGRIAASTPLLLIGVHGEAELLERLRVGGEGRGGSVRGWAALRCAQRGGELGASQSSLAPGWPCAHLLFDVHNEAEVVTHPHCCPSPSPPPRSNLATA